MALTAQQLLNDVIRKLHSRRDCSISKVRVLCGLSVLAFLGHLLDRGHCLWNNVRFSLSCFDESKWLPNKWQGTKARAALTSAICVLRLPASFKGRYILLSWHVSLTSRPNTWFTLGIAGQFAFVLLFFVSEHITPSHKMIKLSTKPTLWGFGKNFETCI